MSRLGYFTPPYPASGEGGVILLSFGSPDVSALLRGALDSLTVDFSFEQVNPAHMTPEESAQYFRNLLYQSWSTANMLVGAILPYATASAPAGTLACDGAQYNRVDYPILYAALDAAFVVDADHFVTPDLTGLFMRGFDGSGGIDIGDTGGADSVTLTVANLPAHTHNYTPPIPNVDLETPGAPDILAAGVGLSTATSSTGDDDPFDIIPPFLAVRYCILHG